jgi:hypothetical protein
MADTPNAGDRRECQGEGLDITLAAAGEDQRLDEKEQESADQI